MISVRGEPVYVTWEHEPASLCLCRPRCAGSEPACDSNEICARPVLERPQSNVVVVVFFF